MEGLEEAFAESRQKSDRKVSLKQQMRRKERAKAAAAQREKHREMYGDDQLPGGVETMGSSLTGEQVPRHSCADPLHGGCLRLFRDR